MRRAVALCGWLAVAAFARAADDPAARCRALLQENPRDAVTACEAAFTATDLHKDIELAEEMLMRASDARVAIADYAGAAATLDRVAALPNAAGRWMRDYRVIRRRGILAYRQGEFGPAATSFRRALDLALAGGDTVASGQSWNDLGNALRRIGRYRDALAAYLASLELKRAAGDAQVAPLLNNLGDLHRDLREYDAAATRYAEALAEYERAGRARDATHTRERLGAVAIDRGDRAEAKRFLDAALAAFHASGAGADELRVCAQLARLAVDAGDGGGAAESIARGRALEAQTGVASTELALQSARWKLASGDAPGADADAAAGLSRLAPDAPERPKLLKVRAEAAAARGDMAAAYAAFGRYHDAATARADAEHDRALGELRVGFDVAEKERELDRLAGENRLTALVLRYRTSQLALVGALMLAGFGLFAALFYRTRQHARAQAAALEAERDGYRRALEALGGDDAETEPPVDDVAESADATAASADTDSPGSDDGHPDDGHDAFRRELVELMLATVAAWERSTGKSRIDLAEKSRVWRVTIDEGRLRVRAMERYLSLSRLPRQPRWREVLRSAYFVLSECTLETAERDDLRRRADAIQADVRRRALR